MKKNIFVFCGGGIFGVVILMLFATYSVHRDGGKPLIGAKVHGDIRISRQKPTPEMKMIGVDSHVMIERNNKIVMLFDFDANNKLSSVLFRLGNGVSFSSSINKGIFSHSSYSQDEYEYKDEGYIYFDNNCDGKFDSMVDSQDRYIFVENSLIRIDDLNDGVTRMYGDDTGREFVFTPEGDWVEKTSIEP